jgi:3-dehydroquinate synthase
LVNQSFVRPNSGTYIKERDHIILQKFSVQSDYPVIFTSGVFDQENKILGDLLMRSGSGDCNAIVIIDSGVVEASPGLQEKISEYGLKHGIPGIAGQPYIMTGGEGCKKDFKEIYRIHDLVAKKGLCRHSFILAIGGGAVLDTAGFAAATAHRGIRLIRFPTTTLAQNDAGIGVKNSVNACGKKNFAGTFACPFAVINDSDFLKSLPERELRCGIAEAVKVALIRDRSFFDFLFGERHQLAAFVPETMQEMILRCAGLHLEHIREDGDPFETGSSRPLDFGHWSAHKIEEITAGAIRHGEAVAIGIALDSLYAMTCGLLDEAEAERIFTVLEETGFELYHPALKDLDIENALREFREHLGGRLTLTMPHGIGQITELNEIDINLYRRCIEMLSEREGV